MDALEQEALEVAKRNRFQYIINLNTSKVTMLAQHEMGFRTHKKVKLNEIRSSSGTLMYPDFSDEHFVSLDYLKLY